MDKLDFTLLADGSSDRTLMAPLMWLLRREVGDIPINGEVASGINLKACHLSDKIKNVISMYPCDLLFIHRDAEQQDAQLRYDEINRAVADVSERNPKVRLPYVCIVPITMTEAWLLIDEQAIRKAAGNPFGSEPLDMPRLGRIEEIKDSKKVLFDLIETACGLRGRRRKKLRIEKCRHLVAQNIADFSPLLTFRAFSRLTTELQECLSRLHNFESHTSTNA